MFVKTITLCKIPKGVGHGGSANGQIAEPPSFPNGTTPSSRCPTPARTESFSTRQSSVGRWRRTSAWRGRRKGLTKRWNWCILWI